MRLKTFFVAAVILFLFHALVTKHLQKITEYVRQVTVPDINEHRGLSKPGHGVGQLDEADTVVQAFENIRADISDAIDIVQEREAFIRLILDSTAEAIYGLDKSGRCLFVNKSCLKMLGYENETELLDKKIHAIIHRTYPNGDPYPEHECQIYKTISQGIATHVDDEFLWRKDGSGFAAEYWSHPTFEKDEISGAVVTFLDRSRRRKFLAEQGRLVSVIENASDFMGVVDLNGTFVFLNYAGRQLLRLGSSISLHEVTLTQIIRECHTENYWGELMSQINKVGNWSGECHLLTQVDQKVIPVIMDVVYIDDKVNVTPTQMAVVIRDMTEIITVQEELKKHRDNLEETVEERTVELKNMLHELETFSYSVSHDLRAPLRGIDGFSLALLEDYGDKLDATGLGYLNKVRSAAQRMASLIDDLLQLSRVTRIEMKKSQLNLSELVENISHSMSEKYADRQIEVKVQQDIIVEGDSGLLKIAVENLLDNAWKYTAKVDAPMISFSVTEIEDRPVYVVQDNGVGFDMRYLHKIFGPFQRLHKVDDFEGSGIGLATVQRVIRRHNGEIWAKSVLSQGATFYFSLGP